MLYRRRREEGDNPAWPGLVDVFAFTLVFVILLNIADNSKKNIDELFKENKQLQQENKKLEEKYEELKKGVAGLKELKEFYHVVKDKLPNDYEINIDEDAIEIIINGVPPIYFETGEYKLSTKDTQRLSRLASLVYPLIREKPFYVLINGTADPRYLYDRGIPPHNNVELSALRSATVADLMEKIAPGVGKYLRVAGLGVRGEEAPPGVDREKYYQQFRTVNLVIKVDIEKLRTISKEGN